MKKFEEGKTYSTRSACDHNCFFSYLVLKRTEKTVTLQDRFGEVRRRKITVWNGEETVMPKGSYSMAPVLGADSIRGVGE